MLRIETRNQRQSLFVLTFTRVRFLSRRVTKGVLQSLLNTVD